MGMFDYFKIDYPLPLESYILSELRPFVNAMVDQDEFQSKDMECLMNRYHIDNNGYLYLSSQVNFEDDSDPVVKKIYHHGHIRVYSLVFLDEDPGTKNKFWLEYDLKFTDGRLIQAKMLSPTKEDINELQLHKSL